MGTIAKSDVELVEASRRGEHDAFGHLVERYQDVVCAVSYSSTGDHGLSEARVVAYAKEKLGEGFAKTIVASYFDQLDVFADGSDLIVSLAISGEQIAQLLAMAKSSVGVVSDAE